MEALEAGLLRALCFYDALDYPPTEVELIAGANCHSHEGGNPVGWPPPMSIGGVTELRGRLVFTGREALIEEHEKREALFPRKIRQAKRVARWLARLGGVRFVALCNTSALAHARDQADLDFFVITKAGTLWQTRLLSVLPFLLFRRRPTEARGRRDAVCLSFFVDDAHLNLADLMLPNDDVYFRYWFLTLLPLYDDGIGQSLWKMNETIRGCHPGARPWVVCPDLDCAGVRFKIPTVRPFEPWARRLQERRFSPAIRAILNRDTRVVANDHVLKFHVEDGREKYRELYRANCRKYGVEP